jgi:hypothetical protein
MAIQDDFSVSVSGDIRYIGSGTTYTVLQLHRYLQDYADNASTSGDDLLDITSSTPSDRSTDNIITLNSPYNIDDVAAKYLYDGSITQAGGATIYSGLVVVGSVTANTEIQITQDENLLASFWGTGLNADAAANILSRFLVKVRANGADIDGRRIIVWSRELGASYAEFSVTMALGNNVAALFTGTDLNNQTAAATIAAWTDIVNTEGYQTLDIAADGSANEPYYAQWDQGSRTKAQLYERTKWLAMRPAAEQSGAETGTDYAVGDGTSTGRAQSFAVGTTAKRITSAKFFLKKFGAPTGVSLVAKVYAHSGTFGTSSVATGGALATSEAIDVSKLTTTYAETELRFLGDQRIALSASTNYVIALEYSGGDASNYVQVRGAAAGSSPGNLATFAGSWAATAAADLSHKVFAAPTLYGVPSAIFRGITHQFDYDTQSTDFAEPAVIAWGTSFAYNSGTGTVPAVGQYWQNSTAGGVGKVVWVSSGAGATGTVVIQREAATPAWSTGNTFALLGGTGAFNINGTVTAPASSTLGGSAITLADSTEGVNSGTLWVQLISGTIAGDNDPIWQRGGTTGSYALVNGSATQRTVSAAFLGSFTGSAIIGAFGIGIDPADGVAADTLTTLADTTVNPPNNQHFRVFGLSTSPADRVLVANNDASAPDYNQFTLNGALTSATTTSVVVNTAIPADTPATGTIRIQLATGVYRLQAYTSWSGSTFTIPSADYSGANQANDGANCFITYIDKAAAASTESITLKYISDRTMFVRVRNGDASVPIKTFETTATFGSGGGSATAIRTADY